MVFQSCMPFVFWLLLSWQSLSCKLAICVLFLDNSSATSSGKNVYRVFFLFLLDFYLSFYWGNSFGFQTSFSSVSNIKIIFHKICIVSIFRRKFLKFLSYRIPYRRRLFHFLYLILNKLLYFKTITVHLSGGHFPRSKIWIQNKVWRKTVTSVQFKGCILYLIFDMQFISFNNNWYWMVIT